MTCQSGVLLSGGLDSGLLLALMNEQGGPWPAYTVGYGESFEDDELTDAAVTAALLGARHVRVKLDQTEFERALPKIVESLEEPIATSSIVPMYFVSQRARQDVKVALDRSGPGRVIRWLQAAPRYSLRKLVARAASRSPIDGRLRRESIAAQ